MQLIISNGITEQDTRIHFESKPPIAGMADIWHLQLPKLVNMDAIARQVSEDEWELRLQAVKETRPFAVLHYTPETFADGLGGVAEKTRWCPTELLVIASGKKFTISLKEFQYEPTMNRR